MIAGDGLFDHNYIRGALFESSCGVNRIGPIYFNQVFIGYTMII